MGILLRALACLALCCSGLQAQSAAGPGSPQESDRQEFGDGLMLELARLARSGDDAALTEALAALRGAIPLVEPDPRAAGRSIVTFLFHGDATVRDVTLPQLRYGTLPLAQAASSALRPPRSLQAHFSRVGDSHLWYLRLNLPDHTLLGYTIARERLLMPEGGAQAPARVVEDTPDPLNPDALGENYVVSVLRLPAAPLQSWIEVRPDVARGRLEQREIESVGLGETRALTVYTPAGYDSAGAKLPLVVVFDGEWYATELGTPNVLDNLIAQGRIPSSVAVFVHAQGTRDRDLVNSASFADFLAGELYPWVAQQYTVSSDPARVVLAGSSFGGLASAFIALRHPGRFGNVLSQSGAFWPPAGATRETRNWEILEGDSELIDLYVRTPRSPLRFYMECGLYESGMLVSNRQLRDVLRAKGYPVTYVEHPGAHNALTWRNSIGDGLIALLGSEPAAPPAPAFPQGWLGTWAGTCSNSKPDGRSSSFGMELRIEPSGSSGRFTWELTFIGPDGQRQQRPYELVVLDAARGHYQIDESDGLTIDSYLIDGVLRSHFEISGALIASTHTVQGDQMVTELVSYDTAGPILSGGRDGAPQLESLPVVNVQRGQLWRRR